MAICLIGTLSAAEEGAAVAPQPQSPAAQENPQAAKKRPDGRDRFRRGPGAWRVLAQMTEPEREALMALQVSDPEKFRAVIKEKTDALYQQELERVKTLRSLVAQYNKSTDAGEKKRIKNEMTIMMKSDFHRRLAENRLQLENMKRRTAQLETELDKRSAKADEIVAAQVESIINGEPVRMPGGPPPHGGPKGQERVPGAEPPGPPPAR